MNMKHMTVRARLVLGFAVAVLAALAIAALGRVEIGKVGREITLLVNDRMLKYELVATMRANVNLIARASRNIVLMSGANEMRAEQERIAQARAANTALLDKLDTSIVSARGQALLQRLKQVREPYNQAVDQAVALGLDNQDEAAREVLLNQARKAQMAYFSALEDLLNHQKTLMNDSAAAAQDTVSRAGTLMLTIAAVAVLASAGLGWAITRSLTRQLGGEPAYAAKVANEVASGNLAVPVALRAGDGDSMLAAMHAMRGSLAKVVGKVRAGAEGVASASAQIAEGNQDLSARTESQASALEQTAASMEQLSSTVKQNADHASQANQLAQAASAVALRGGAVVGEVVQTMQGINVASRKIGDIINVIDGIAFQTNILALNAAVEAARAGEQGRGFAVVATEVRSLAGRSAEAAREIKTLIGDSVQRVEQGTTLVDQAGHTMAEVVNAIAKVTEIMGDISAASVEQAAGVAQVGEAVLQMDEATQQNAALVEEMAGAAAAMRSQAEELVQAVAVFTLATPAPQPVAAASTDGTAPPRLAGPRTAGPRTAAAPERMGARFAGRRA